MKHRSDRKWLALPLAVTAALLAGLAAPPAHAEQRPDSGGWQSYLEQPDSSNVQAVSATVLSGSVSNARGLTAYGHGITATSTLTGGFMGGFRFEAITLSAPGTVVLSAAGVQFGGGYLATAADYQGYFLSSSGAFVAMYYDGAYTEQTDMQPAGPTGPRSLQCSTAPSATGRSGPGTWDRPEHLHDKRRL